MNQFPLSLNYVRQVLAECFRTDYAEVRNVAQNLLLMQEQLFADLNRQFSPNAGV